MSKAEKNLSQIISEAQITILDSNESICEDRLEDSNSFMKDALLAKCRDTIEVIPTQTLYTEIESQKRQRREAELTSRETQSTVQNLEKRLKESNSRVITFQEENEKLSEQIESLKKSLKQSEKSSVVNKVREDLQDEISVLKIQVLDKTSQVQDLQSMNKVLEGKLARVEYENEKFKEEIEEMQGKYEDLVFKCERLAAQARISETVTSNLKQAQDDYQRYVKEERENYESKEKELREKFETFENKLKKRYQSKEVQLKQEVKESIEEIQRSLEINNGEFMKTRAENSALKETIRKMNEREMGNEHGLREQIDKLENELQNALLAVREKTTLLERNESIQKFEKSKIEGLGLREKELESQVKALEEKCKVHENRNLEVKKTMDGLNGEISALKGELIKEASKFQSKEHEIKQLLEREKDFNLKISKLKDEKAEETAKHTKELEDKIESTVNIMKQQLLREYESKLDDLKTKISELQAENKILKLKPDRKQEIKPKSRQVYDTKESASDELLYEELNTLKSKLTKMTSLKAAADQKCLALKEEFSHLEEKIKQDSLFFRNETMRKDEELGRMKKKFETKLREIYTENSIITEQLRTDLLRLHSEVRNRDLSESSYWLSKSLEDLMKKIPSY